MDSVDKKHKPLTVTSFSEGIVSIVRSVFRSDIFYLNFFVVNLDYFSTNTLIDIFYIFFAISLISGVSAVVTGGFALKRLKTKWVLSGCFRRYRLVKYFSGFGYIFHIMQFMPCRIGI